MQLLFSSYNKAIKFITSPKLRHVWVRVCVMHRVGQNRIYAPYITVHLVISLPKIPYIHRIYMILANPSDAATSQTHDMRIMFTML